MSKVVHIVTDTNIGGAGVWLKRTLEVIEEDFEVTVIIPEQSLLKDYLATLDHVQLLEVANIGDQSFSVKGVFTLAKVLKRLQPDVVHTHASLSGRLAAKMTKGTWCMNSRHCIEPVDPRPIIRGLKGWVNNRLSDQIVAVSQGVYDNLLASGVPKSKLVLVPNGVDPLNTYSKVEIEQTKSFYGVQGKKVLGYVGRLASVKGPEYLLDIMTYMKEEGREDVVLLVAGDGPLKKTLEAEAQVRGLKKQIQWLGFVDQTEALYNVMDICLNTSRSEAISLTLLEAMSIGLPVMAFDVDGLDQVIIQGENGYLIPPFKTDLYSKQVLKIIDDQDLKEQLGSKGAAFVRDHYNMEQMIHKLITTYKEKHVL